MLYFTISYKLYGMKLNCFCTALVLIGWANDYFGALIELGRGE
jgi:hypothetical protein